MQRDSDEDAWRAIVENYGDRIELDDEPDAPAGGPLAGPVAGATGGQVADPAPEQRPEQRPEERLERLFRPLPQPRPEERFDDLEDDGFVPPPPPPLPKLPPDRLLAWSGLFGSPSVLLVCLVLQIHLAPWLGYLLVGSFIGGFVYLVAKMPHGTDIDPWDDGARL